MLVGMTADRRGLIPSNDVAKVTRFGQYISRCYSTPLAGSTEAAVLYSPADYVDLNLDLTLIGDIASGSFDRFWIREDITTGQRVRGFTVSTTARTRVGGGGLEPEIPQPVVIYSGDSIGHKRIGLLNGTLQTSAVQTVRFRVTDAMQWPVPVAEVAVFAPCGKP